MSDVANRREFVAAVAVGVALPALCCGGARGADEPAPTTALGWIPTVKPEALKSGDFNMDFADKHKFILTRVENKIMAVNTKCTHKGCAVKAKETLIECPCHHAQYDATGHVTKAPAKDDLARYALRLNNDGVIEVDTTHQIKGTETGAVLETATAKPAA